MIRDPIRSRPGPDRDQNGRDKDGPYRDGGNQDQDGPYRAYDTDDGTKIYIVGTILHRDHMSDHGHHGGDRGATARTGNGTPRGRWTVAKIRVGYSVRTAKGSGHAWAWSLLPGTIVLMLTVLAFPCAGADRGTRDGGTEILELTPFIMLVMAAAVMLWLMLAGWTYHDAKRWHLNPRFWSILVLVFNIFGLVAYLACVNRIRSREGRAGYPEIPVARPILPEERYRMEEPGAVPGTAEEGVEAEEREGDRQGEMEQRAREL